MERWRGVLKVPLKPGDPSLYRVAVSLCLSTNSPKPSQEQQLHSANAILFQGDRVAGSCSPVIERLSDPQRIADILVSKFGDFVNAWVIEASIFNGPFAVYRDFIPSVNRWGDPKSYDPTAFPASTSIVSLLSNCLNEIKKAISASKALRLEPSVSASTCILGFSKGGTVINQLVTELSHIGSKPNSQQRFQTIVPGSKEDFLNSISQVHYVDVGLNSAGAYVTSREVIERIGKRFDTGGGSPGIRFVIHGTPRQWCDDRRVWIREEKDKLVHLLEREVGRTGGKLQVLQKMYFSEKVPDMEMHFEIIEAMDVR